MTNKLINHLNPVKDSSFMRSNTLQYLLRSDEELSGFEVIHNGLDYLLTSTALLAKPIARTTAIAAGLAATFEPQYLEAAAYIGVVAGALHSAYSLNEGVRLAQKDMRDIDLANSMRADNKRFQAMKDDGIKGFLE